MLIRLRRILCLPESLNNQAIIYFWAKYTSDYAKLPYTKPRTSYKSS